MKRFGILLVAILLGTASILAQPGEGQRNTSPEDMAKRQTAQLKEILDFSEDQEKQVYELNMETMKKMRDLRAKNRGAGSEGMLEQMRELREKQFEKMKEILTEAQWIKYQKHIEERREERWSQVRSGRRR